MNRLGWLTPIFESVRHFFSPFFSNFELPKRLPTALFFIRELLIDIFQKSMKNSFGHN